VDDTAGAAVWTIIAEPPVTYAIGDTGPAGGFVFSITEGGLHGLEAATEDQTPTAWGCNGVDITGADGTAVGTGEQNTADITAACLGITAASVAAGQGPGWFLPSRDELDLMWEHLADRDGNNYNSGPTDLDNVGVFAQGTYWSSSEVDDASAWDQGFVDGTKGGFSNNTQSGTMNKVNSQNRVRAVRAF
jgi:hypothetical protein